MAIKGLKRVCGDSKCLGGNRGLSLQVFYNLETEQAWGHFVVGNDFIVYRNENRNIINCGVIQSPMPMKSIRAQIEFYVNRELVYRKRLQEYLEEVKA